MKATTDYDDKMRIHVATVAYRQGRLSRRDLLKYLGAAGVALASARLFTPRALASPAAVSLLQDSPVPHREAGANGRSENSHTVWRP